MTKKEEINLTLIAILLIIFALMYKCTSFLKNLKKENDRVVYEHRCLEYKTGVIVGQEQTYGKQRTFIVMFSDSTFTTYKAPKNSYNEGDSCDVCAKYNQIK